MPADATPPPEYPTEGEERRVWVRYGKFPRRGWCRCRTRGLVYADPVVVRTERGEELGEVAFAGREEGNASPAGWVLRRATPEDLARDRARNDPPDGRGPEFRFCAAAIRRLGLPMRLVAVERPLGEGRLTFYFQAEGRVDFRGLVRELARKFRCRIELRQIGGRDAARLLGDVGDCGRELCCRTCLTRLAAVQMKMAKVQKTTLDPAKISGRCGRLKCCLRYEYETYRGLRARLPRVGATVWVGGRRATVQAVDLLGQQVTVAFPGGEGRTVSAEAVATAPPPAGSAAGDDEDGR